MKCPNCGTENDGDAVFCKKCGTKIEVQSDSEDLSWVDKVDFTKGIDWDEKIDQPEQKKEEPVIEVDLSQKQRAQMWENLQRKKATEKQVQESLKENREDKNLSLEKGKRKDPDPEEEPELDVIPGVNRRYTEPIAVDNMKKPEPEEVFDDDDDYDFDEYDYEDDEENDDSKPPIGILVGIIGVVAAIVVLAIVLFNVFSNRNSGYIPSTRPVGSGSTSADTSKVQEMTTEEATTAEETTTVEETTVEETTVEETTVEETTVEETTEEETTVEETTQPDPEPVVQDGLTYHFHNGEAYVGVYSGDATEIYVASEVNGYPVRYVDADAFRDCQNLKKLYIPEGVVEIGENALYNCTSLSQIVLPSTLTKIGQGAFDYCPAFTIVGQEGTYAQQFANLYHVNFVAGIEFTE